MRNAVFLGLMVSASLIPAGFGLKADPGSAASAPGLSIGAGQSAAGMSIRRSGHRFRGGMRNGHRFIRRGHRFGGNTRFFVGGFLPRLFLAPRYYVTNYPTYGLARPARGYRWVRYYDDAYMVDDRGYIADYRYGVPYGDGYARDDRVYCEPGYRRRGGGGGGGGAAAGAIAGGVLGGVAGNLIAGRGDRTEGTIIGAGLGAIAGGAIGSAAERDRYRYDRDRDCYYLDEDYRPGVSYRYDERVPEYVGEGDYYPDPRIAYDFDRSPRVVRYGEPVRTEVRVGDGATQVITHASNGIGQNATTTIVLGNSALATTTTTVIEEY